MGHHNMANRGKLLIGGILAVAVLAATVAWWYQFHQGQRVLQLWGAESAYLIRLAPDCTLSELGSQAGRSRELSGQPGFIHARQALIQDASYDWLGTTALAQRTTDSAQWQYELVFREADRSTRLWLDLDNDWIHAPDRGVVADISPIADGLRTFIGEQLRREN